MTLDEMIAAAEQIVRLFKAERKKHLPRKSPAYRAWTADVTSAEDVLSLLRLMKDESETRLT